MDPILYIPKYIRMNVASSVSCNSGSTIVGWHGNSSGWRETFQVEEITPTRICLLNLTQT